MAARHYHVIVNVPGYLPESDPYVCTSLKDAISYAKSEKNDLLEDNEYRKESGIDLIHAYGNARDIDKNGGTIYTIDDGSLGWTIDIMPCTEDRPECTGEE